MVAYQFALENLQLKDRNDTEPYTAKIKELTEVLETYFKEHKLQSLRRSVKERNSRTVQKFCPSSKQAFMQCFFYLY